MINRHVIAAIDRLILHPSVEKSLLLRPATVSLISSPESSVKADQVFHPMIETASKAHRVRSTLGVFERSGFFFNLPGSLVESIEAVSELFFRHPPA